MKTPFYPSVSSNPHYEDKVWGSGCNKKHRAYALFVSAIMISRKWVIFQKSFSTKLSYFLMFGSNFKRVEKQFPNWWC